MRTTLVLLVALLFAAPAMAATTVTINCYDDGCGVVRVGYEVTGDPNRVRAFALDFDVDDGNIVEIFDYKEGESTSDDPGYGIFPGRIQIDANGIVIGWGTPEGDPSQHSDTKPGIPHQGITIEMGSLYVDDVNAPASSGTLCRFRVEGHTVTANVSVSENGIRGGIVLEDPDAEANVVLNGLVLSESKLIANVQTWIDKGRPQAWCCEGHQNGDANNDGNLNVFDIIKIKSEWGSWDCQADVTEDGNLNVFDIIRIKSKWGQDPGPACNVNWRNCPTP
jgi:hypothetical protein